MTQRLLPDGLPAIETLKARPHWVAWRSVVRVGRSKPTKVPVNPHTGGNASVSNPATWAAFDIAEARAINDELGGVGIVLTGDGLIGVDLDDCVGEDGTPQPWVADVLALAETYAELSPSGRGIHLFAEGTLAKAAACNPAHVELYIKGRCLTVTGRHLPGTPIEIRPAPKTLAALLARIDSFRKPDTKLQQDPPPTGANNFFRAVNNLALENLSAWVPSIFPSARFQSASGAWRVPPEGLPGHDGLEEDLSASPDGIVDFGIHDMGDPRAGKRTPIDVVLEHGNAADPVEAAFWLCAHIGRDPEALGWEGPAVAQPRSEETGDAPPPKAPGETITATPYQWAEPSTIPPRQWLYGRHLIRQFLSVDIAPGGVGKSALVTAEALSLVVGRDLLNNGARLPQCKVWMWNGEDPHDELQRRIQAACIHYGISRTEIEGRLFVDTGRKAPIIIARVERNTIVIAVPLVEAMMEAFRSNGIDVFFGDPFVTTHAVPENDNGMINAVAQQWAKIADETNSAIDLVHHVRKPTGGELTAEDARGASALIAASRSTRGLNRMTPEEAEKAGVQDNHRLYFRLDNAKANLAPPGEAATWRKMESVYLGNGEFNGLGDNVGVVTAWAWPDPFDGVTLNHLREVQRRISQGEFRADPRAQNWAGKVVAEVLEMDLTDPAARASVRNVLIKWRSTGALRDVIRTDGQRKPRTFVVVGERV